MKPTVKGHCAHSTRAPGSEATKQAVLTAARELFAARGIDRVTIAEIAEAAGVASSSVYALFKSKEGILSAIMRVILFGPRFQSAQAALAGVTDPVEAIARTATVARAVYESESDEAALLRGASSFSASLRRIEGEFEDARYDMQRERLELLAGSGRMKPDLTLADARRIMWMYTSREVYRMLVHDGGWSADRYEQWLAETLRMALVNPSAQLPAS